jgi:hypothetical protein
MALACRVEEPPTGSKADNNAAMRGYANTNKKVVAQV